MLDFVVMSHRHGDHMGGLAYVLKVNPKVKIYAPKERSGVYGDDQPSSSWYRKDTSQPVEQRYYSGKPPETDKSTEIAPGMYLIALVLTGGLHEIQAPDPEVERIATVLHDQYKVERVAPGHCTGEPEFAALKRAFGGQYASTCSGRGISG
jgi:7,8-dihydropterin-6-yl-methyl-4-(beta-D-ribofuranosyl)aminobenzene 5'-phosphate synthase